jgi:HSP20 family protein
LGARGKAEVIVVGTKKRKDFVEDFGSELFDNLEEMIEALLDEMGESAPFIYGFSIIHRPGEDPEIRELGNNNQENNLPQEEDFIPQNTKKPLIDVFEDEETVHILAELPDAKKEDIHLRVATQSLEIKVSGSDSFNFSEEIELPKRVDKNSAKATYKNGVLEVTLRRYIEEDSVTVDID